MGYLVGEEGRLREEVTDVLDTEGPGVDSSNEGLVEGGGAVALQKVVEHVDLAEPVVGTTMDDLGG
jgi:hypothetical protein